MRGESDRSEQAITASAKTAPHTGGGDGFYPSNVATATQMAYDQESRPLREPAQVVPSSRPAQETLEAFAAEFGATIGELCEKCGCALYRHMAEYQVCIRCYP